MATDIIGLKSLYYVVYLCGINVFPKKEEPGMPVKVIYIISNAFCKLFILSTMIILGFVVYFAWSEVKGSSYDLFSRGIPVSVDVSNCL